jgi:hypothetical protein
MLKATMMESKGQSVASLLLRIESLVALVAVILLYSQQSGDWGAFLVLLLTPDLAFVPYAINQELGRRIYNLVHTYSLPLALAVVALLGGWSIGVSLALIWLAHISLDRAIGYGIKYTSEKGDTHLQRI